MLRPPNRGMSKRLKRQREALYFVLCRLSSHVKCLEIMFGTDR